MQIATFDDLLSAARAQAQPQRLLLVFMGAEVPADATPEQRAAVAAGQGGVLVPLMCVDKAPEELTTIGALAEESRRAGPDWSLVFAAALGGSGGRAPTSAQTEAVLTRMLECLKRGSHENFIPFDLEGRAVRIA